MAEVYDLYPLLNDRGALYVDANEFTTEALTQPVPAGTLPTMTVNPNYLRAFPVLDEAGVPVRIPEQTTDWVVLAPAALKPQKAKLQRQVEQSRRSIADSEQSVLGREVPTAVSRPSVRIVWTANDQRVFGFNPQVYPDVRNEVPDPVIEVMTLSNSAGADRLNGVSGGPDGALKVHLDGDGAAATLRRLRPTLERLKLADNLRSLVTMNDYVLLQAQQIREGIRVTLVVAAAVAVGLLVLVVEGLTIVFQRHSRHVVVRRLFGLGFARTYREFLRLFTLLWVLQALVVLGLDAAGFSPFGAVSGPVVVLGVVIAAMLAELLVSAAILISTERRGALRVLKEEF